MTLDSRQDCSASTGMVDVGRPTANGGPTCAKKTQIVSLFSGAGGMDLGFHQAGFELAVAIDGFSAAIDSYSYNFKSALAHVGDLNEIGPDGVLDLVRKRVPKGGSIGVIGGPPCQGFSRANISAETDDPRNSLPKLYLEIVKALQREYVVEFLVVENVLGIRDKKHAATYAELVSGIDESGFNVNEWVLSATDFGVAQRRSRVILVGMNKQRGYAVPRVQSSQGALTVRDVIGHLAEPVLFSKGVDCSDFPEHVNHWTMRPKSHRFSQVVRPSSKRRSFKCLDWHKPSPTIAFGNREIHVHPDGHRRISIYEAMLLQGFPKHFVLKGNLSQQVTQVSNAVPPPLAKGVAEAICRAMENT